MIRKDKIDQVDMVKHNSSSNAIAASELGKLGLGHLWWSGREAQGGGGAMGGTAAGAATTRPQITRGAERFDRVASLLSSLLSAVRTFRPHKTHNNIPKIVQER